MYEMGSTQERSSASLPSFSQGQTPRPHPACAGVNPRVREGKLLQGQAPVPVPICVLSAVKSAFTPPTVTPCSHSSHRHSLFSLLPPSLPRKRESMAGSPPPRSRGQAPIFVWMTSESFHFLFCYFIFSKKEQNLYLYILFQFSAEKGL